MAAFFADDIFVCIFLNENIWIVMKISLKFVHRGPIDNMTAMAPNRRQVIIWTNDELGYRHVSASLGLNEFSPYSFR